jgi:hypothetical protein
MWKPAIVIMAVLLGAIGSGCGDAGPLEHVGDATARWVTAATVPPTLAPEVVVEIGDEGLVEARGALWVNDDLTVVSPGADPKVATVAVWARQDGSRFVQSRRVALAAALPTVQFPETIPADVRWVTSQLVFDPASGLLDPDTSAAFGLWTVEPYTVESGRIAVLRVGSAPEGIGAEKSDVVPIIVPDGMSLGWTEAGLRYELFCRASVSEAVCNAMVESFVPLANLLPA